MAIKVFLLGRPGSGKSTAAHTIDMLIRNHGWTCVHINDYEFLSAMYREDIHYQKFRPSIHGGFDVLDFSVLDSALRAVELTAQLHLACSNKFLLLEFARDNYQQALKQFHPMFLHDAYFLFFEADIDLCIQRVYARSAHPTDCNDHFISEQMIRSYYREDNKPYLTRDLLVDYGVSPCRVRVINNVAGREEFNDQIKRFINDIFESDAGSADVIAPIYTTRTTVSCTFSRKKRSNQRTLVSATLSKDTKPV